MTAPWAGSIIATIMCAGSIATMVWRAGRRDGKVDQILEQLTAVAQDREQRIRDLQRDQWPARRAPGRHR